MDKKILVSAALASVVGLASLGQSAVAAEKKERCFGVAMAGANDCAAANGAHSCAGQASKDKDPYEWKYVKSGSCVKMGGALKAPAKQ